jgi:hypothetical protein
MLSLSPLKFIRVVGVLGVVLGDFVLFVGAVFSRVFVGSVSRCLFRCLSLGCRLGFLCILQGASRSYCVLRGALLI